MPFARNQQFIGEILTQSGRLSLAQLRRALKMQGDLGKRRGSRPKLGELLVRCNLIDEVDLAKGLASQFDCQYLEPEPGNVRPALFPEFSADLMRSYKFVPLGRDHDSITVAVASFDEADLPDILGDLTGSPITCCVTTEDRLEELRRTYLAVLESLGPNQGQQPRRGRQARQAPRLRPVPAADEEYETPRRAAARSEVSDYAEPAGEDDYDARPRRATRERDPEHDEPRPRRRASRAEDVEYAPPKRRPARVEADDYEAPRHKPVRAAEPEYEAPDYEPEPAEEPARYAAPRADEHAYEPARPATARADASSYEITTVSFNDEADLENELQGNRARERGAESLFGPRRNAQQVPLPDPGEPIEVPYPVALGSVLYRLLTLAVRENYVNLSFASTGEPVQVLAHRATGQTDLFRASVRIRDRIRAGLAGIAGVKERDMGAPLRRRIRWLHEGGMALFEMLLFPPGRPQIVLNMVKSQETHWGLEETGLKGRSLALVAGYSAKPAGCIVLCSRQPNATSRVWVSVLADQHARKRHVLAVEPRLTQNVPGIEHLTLDQGRDGGRKALSQVVIDTLTGRQCEVLAMRADEMPTHVGEMLDASRGRTMMVLRLPSFSALAALRCLERASGRPATDGLVAYAYRTSRLCPMCREPYSILPDMLPAGEESLTGCTAYRAAGCSACLQSGQFGPAHFYDVLRLDGGLLDRDGIDYYSRSLKDYLLEKQLLVTAVPAARQALMAGDIGLDEYLSIASRPGQPRG